VGTTMRRNDIFTVAASILVAIFFLGGMGFDAYRKHLDAESLISEYRIHSTPEEVIGPYRDFRGEPNSPYTLVEFGDYECPPCHAANEQVAELMPSLKGKVRFAFRNFPLTSIHPYAMRAAIEAEAARSLGKFWAAHDGLYSADASSFNADTITNVERSLHLPPVALANAERTTAAAAVHNDMSEARAIRLTGTPSFVLCCPDGRVVHLSSLSQLGKIVQ